MLPCLSDSSESNLFRQFSFVKGLIGRKAAAKVSGLVEKVLCFDVYPDHEWIKTIPNASYVDMDTLLRCLDSSIRR